MDELSRVYSVAFVNELCDSGQRLGRQIRHIEILRIIRRGRLSAVLWIAWSGKGFGQQRADRYQKTGGRFSHYKIKISEVMRMDEFDFLLVRQL